MKRNTIISILAVLAIGALFFFILQRNKKKNEENVAVAAQTNSDVTVRTAKVQRQDVDSNFNVNGTFVPNKQAQISAEVGGQIEELYVKEGSYVRAGQRIARLGGEKLNTNVLSARANYDNAVSALNRYEMAYKTGGVTALQLDQARTQVKTARAQLQGAQLNSGDTNVVSKISGIVNQKMVEVGTVVNPGTPMVEIVDISAVKLKVDVDQSLVSQLALGNTVKIKPDVIDGTIDGRITFIAPSASGALKFPVEITVPNSFNKLKAGMYATAIFGTAGSTSKLTIPRDAFVGSISDNKVFIVKNGVAYLTKIQSGNNYGGNVEVISGLNDGDEVVTSGQINLNDKTKVTVLR